MTLSVGSLFSGVGGVDLGLERAGMTVKWQSEIDPYACRVLAKHWPHVPNLGDVTMIDWSGVEPVDLICGGYPCQPFSLAGKRAGTDDARHLWPFFADALRHLRPRYALLENVPGHLSLGFGRVLGDLAELGFDAEWESIPAAAVGAPHLRYRLFVVAHADGQGQPGVTVDALTGPRVVVPDTQRIGLRHQPVAIVGSRHPALADNHGPDGDVADSTLFAQREPADEAVTVSDRWDAWPLPRRRGWWSTEPNVGRVADGVPSRVDRLRALGNAVVPAVAEYVGRRILDVA